MDHLGFIYNLEVELFLCLCLMLSTNRQFLLCLPGCIGGKFQHGEHCMFFEDTGVQVL